MLVLNCRRVRILNFLGLHLRAADKFARLAQRFQAELLVARDDGGGKEVDGKTILDLMTLAAGCGVRLELRASGPDAEATVDALSELIEARFHEADDA
jgi:phosphocarrier protein HPr